jgi:hypothetical protein
LDASGKPALQTLRTKAARVHRPDIKSWLPSLFDDLPISQATYAIRYLWYLKLEKYQDTDHPAHYAWKEVAPRAIKMIEFVMDIRKGDYSDEEIASRMAQISKIMAEIRQKQEEGHPFACTVTSQKVLDIEAFLTRFPTLQSYLDEITGQVYLKRYTLDALSCQDDSADVVPKERT